MNRKEYAESISVLEVGLGKTIPEGQHEVWFEVVKDIDADPFRKAIIVFLSEGDDWPSIAKLRKLATEQTVGIGQSHGEAFEIVMRQVRQYSKPEEGRRIPELTERHDSAVMQCGGWDRFCDCPPDQRGTLAAQFRMAWQESSGTEKRLQNLPEQVRPRLDGPAQSALTSLADSMRLE